MAVAPGVHQFSAPDGSPRLDLLIAARLDLSRNQAATLIAAGRVRVAGRDEKASYRPRAGETVVVDLPEPRGRDVVPEQIPLPVVYEDDDLLVVDKPAGMVVHPAPGHWGGTLANALRGRRERPDLTGTAAAEREGIVHRLDKETSGLLLVAKTDRVHRALAAALASRRISRRYAVLARGHLTSDRLTVERPIGRDPRDRKRMAIVGTGRAARTDFTRLARFDAGDLLRAQLHTGRTHQIRVHLASIGHPVVGDATYGSRGRGSAGRQPLGLPEGRHFLHAAWLIFRHPITGVEIDLRSPLPAELSAALAAAAPDAPLPADREGDLLEAFGFYRIHVTG